MYPGLVFNSIQDRTQLLCDTPGNHQVVILPTAFGNLWADSSTLKITAQKFQSISILECDHILETGTYS